MITAWSFSRYNTYKQCPLKAKLQYIDKIKEPPSAPMQRGSDIHKIAEDYITLPGRRLVPDDLMMFANLFRKLRKQHKKVKSDMVVESEWAFKKDWTQTGWFDADCWLRMKLDVAWHEEAFVMIVNDWKTGKYRPDNIDSYVEQLELFALGAFLKYPHITLVKPQLAYLDLGITYPDVEKQDMFFTRDFVPTLMDTWEQRVEPMLSDEIFAPRPNQFCNWCHFRATEGGQCKF
jgi:hypothetical protein